MKGQWEAERAIGGLAKNIRTFVDDALETWTQRRTLLAIGASHIGFVGIGDGSCRSLTDDGEQATGHGGGGNQEENHHAQHRPQGSGLASIAQRANRAWRRRCRRHRRRWVGDGGKGGMRRGRSMAGREAVHGWYERKGGEEKTKKKRKTLIKEGEKNARKARRQLEHDEMGK